MAEVFTGGTIRLSGSSYYNLENQDLVLDIVRSALEGKNDSGVLKDYSLRYMRRVGVVSVRIAFTDCSMERATMRSLLLRGGLVTLTALLVLTGLSYWLAGFAVRPVRRAWQEQKQFVSDASHELKTPLTVILSSTELAGGERDPEKTKQYVEGIRAESLRMKALVEDMLTLARTESGAKQTLDAVNLSDTVLESALAFEPVAFESGRELSYDIQPELTVRGSAVQLRRLADILLDNAMKYAAAGTPVGLLLRPEGRALSCRWKTGGRPSRRRSCRICSTGSTGWMSPAPAGRASAWAWPSPRVLCRPTAAASGCTSAEGITRFTVTLPLLKNDSVKRGQEGC